MSTATIDTWTIEAATPEDRAWIEPLFHGERGILGADFGSVWYRYWQADHARERWDVIRPYAFAHFRRRRDGVTTLYEIAVDPRQRRCGLGRALMAHLGRPLQLKTDAADAVSNAFYRGLGFTCVGRMAGTHGTKVLHVYQAW